MPKYVRASVILCVEEVDNWTDAYQAVSDLVGGPAMFNWTDRGKFRSAYLRKVISVEGFVLKDCCYCEKPIIEGQAWREEQNGDHAHEGCWLTRHPKEEW